jgi:hypothetical protein
MKKQELIHLHGLLAEVSDHLEACGEELDLSDYEDHGVRPTSIHKSKTNHKTAVFALVDGITGSIETESEPLAATAD